MVKIRLHGEPEEMDKLIELMCNEFSAIRVLSVSERYKDRGASVYERCYIDIAINEQMSDTPSTPKSTAIIRQNR